MQWQGGGSVRVLRMSVLAAAKETGRGTSFCWHHSRCCRAIGVDYELQEFAVVESKPKGHFRIAIGCFTLKVTHEHHTLGIEWKNVLPIGV